MHSSDARIEYYARDDGFPAAAGGNTIYINLYVMEHAIARLADLQKKSASYADWGAALYGTVMDTMCHEVNHLARFEVPGTHTHHSDQTIDKGFAQRMRRTIDRVGKYLSFSLNKEGGLKIHVDPGYEESPIDWDLRRSGKASFFGTRAYSPVKVDEASGTTREIDTLPPESIDDIENALYLCGEPMLAEFVGENSYEIRYDKMRLEEYRLKAGIDPASSPEALLKAYVYFLKMHSDNPENIRLIECSGKEHGLSSLISVKRYTGAVQGEPAGEACVNIKGDLSGRKLRLIGMLNMAVAATKIRKNTAYSGMNDYERRLIAFIKDQCALITGLEIPEEDILEYIKNLPEAAAVSVDKLEGYYRLTIAALRRAA